MIFLPPTPISTLHIYIFRVYCIDAVIYMQHLLKPMKTSLLIAIFFIVNLTLSIGLFAQSKWVYSYGSNSMDEALCSDAYGSAYFVGGYFSQGMQMGGENVQSNGFSDAFVTKLNSQGVVDWVQTIGGVAADRILDVHAHSSGKVAVTGYITGTVTVEGETISTNAGSQDAFVMLCDAQGDLIWAIPLGGGSADTGYGVSMDEAGNVYCTGQFKGEAQFGPFTLTSMENPLDNTPSHDIFVVKIDQNGTVQWVKQGAAIYDDRGLSLCNDTAGNLYVAGQSSDTLHMGGISYSNNVINSGFVLKLDVDGNEQWFTRLAAFQTLINEIEYGSDDNLYLTGDHIGQMAILSENDAQFFPPDNSYNVFLAKMNLDGEAVWLSNVGSINEVSSKSLCEGENGEWYIAGTFKCQMSSFAELYGSGMFYSLGYRDVFVARYNSSGLREWERNYGSPKDDYCAAIEYGGENDPLFFGSYGNKMSFPDGPGFIDTDDTYTPYWIEYVGNYCGDNTYGRVQMIDGIGALDIFMAKPVQLDRQPLDIFKRSDQSDCSQDFREMCLNAYECPDTLELCGSAGLLGYTFTYDINQGGPEIEAEWSGELENINTSPPPYYATSYTDQWVYFEIERIDGCYTSMDSIYTIVHPIPPQPLISDDVVVNTECTSCTPIQLCEVQEVTLTASGITEENFGWVDVGLPGEATLTTSTPGYYHFYQTNEFGCTDDSHVYISFATPPDSVAPYMRLTTNGSTIGVDSVGLCPENWARFDLQDSINGFPGNDFYYGSVLWSLYFEGDFIEENTLNSGYDYQIDFQSTGWHVVHASYTEYFCGNPTQTYPTLIDSVYIESYPGPQLNVYIQGSNLLCPGGSEILVATGAENYEWYGPEFTILSPDSIEVFAVGDYGISATETNEFGCSDVDYDSHEIDTNFALVSMLPENGIVCPFDSVLLFTDEFHLSYQWIGPMGEQLGTEQQQWANVPGYYHCQVLDMDSCYLETNFLELKEYSSPYLEVFPGNDLCVGGAIQLTIYTNDEAQVQWLSPLSGSSNQQLIEEPGTYTVLSTLCDITNTLEIDIIFTEVLAEITVLSDLPACPGDTVILQGNPGMSFYDWNPGGIQSQYLEVTESGLYNLGTIDAHGCLGFAEPVEIEFIDAVAEIVEAAESACPGETVVLEGEGTGVLSWYIQPNEEAVAIGDSFEFVMGDEAIIVGVSSTVGNCESPPSFVTVDVHASASPPDIELENGYCLGDEIILASNSGELNWTGPGGSYTGDQWELGPANEDLAGSYELSHTNNLCNSPSSSFEVIIYPTTHVELSILNDSICDGEEAILFAPSGLHDIQWIPGNETGDTLLTDVGGFYWIEALDGNSCQVVSDTISLVVFNSPPAPPAIDTVGCIGSNLALISEFEGSISWFNPFTGDTIVAADLSLILSPQQANIETWYQVINAAGCASESAPINIEVTFGGSEISINAPDFICEGSELVLSTDTEAEQYLWIYPDGLEQGENVIVFEDVNTAMTGIYQVVLSQDDCILSSDELFIEVIEDPEGLIDEELIDCIGGVVVLQSPPGLIDPLWNGSSAGEFYLTQEAGWQYLEGIIEPGCAVRDSIYLDTIECEYTEPNIFSPNNDGINDYYDFSNWSYRIESIKIYNRWGNVVRELNRAPFVWDGTNNGGGDLLEGVYFITLNSEIKVRGEYTMKGVVHIQR